MLTKKIASDDESPTLVAGRYQIEERLGKGGMGTVYRVYDKAVQKRIALKRALERTNSSDNRDPSQEQRYDTQKTSYSQQMLQQEYQTLRSLAHPRIVDVYDFGIDEKGPFYTMELLDGEDLFKLAPLQWRKACELLRDVASALSLLHSRKMLHRDVTARNVRCTADGRAKLMDFGAMTPMGVSKDVAGTPPHIPPETVYDQSLDQRADLYSLGALAYWLLTGGHAYPGSKLRDLIDLWRSQPAPPSSIVSDIPEALDTLVMSMMSLDALARPSCAAEVIERLSAIASLTLDEQLVVRQAYLWTPSLVGRDGALLRVRKQIIRSIRSRGKAIVVRGAGGTGRSRFLDACVLEGKLSGLTVLRADASDAQTGDYGVTRALVNQLLREIPDLARLAAEPYLSALQYVVPQLVTESEAVSIDDSKKAKESSSDDGDSQQLRPKIQAALRAWFIDIALFRSVLIAVDDLNRIDEPSAAFLSLLADQVSNSRLVVIVTSESEDAGTSQRALSLLSNVGTTIELGELNREETESLFISVFGDVPNVRLVADRLYAISGGIPKTLMQIAQHLMDNERVVYHAGAWTLPGHIDADDLPHTLSDARRLRIQALEPSVRELAQTMALCSKESFSHRDCFELAAHRDRARLNEELNTLVVSEILSTNGERYSLSHESWRKLLEEDVDPERAKQLHLRIVTLLNSYGNEQFRVTQHLLNAGQEERALDFFLEHIKEFGARLAKDKTLYLAYVRSLPEDWIDTLEWLLAICKKMKRPRIEHFYIQSRLLGWAAPTAKPVKSHIKELAAQLYRDSGLDLYYAADSALEPPIRLQQALEAAQKRFDETIQSERVLPPTEAIPQLATTIIESMGSCGSTHDHEFFASLPSLQPFSILSPALEVVEKNFQSTIATNAGRIEQAVNGWLEVIDRMEQPDRAGLDDSNHTYMRLAIMYAIGFHEAILGLPSTLTWEELEKNPLFEVNACHLRMLFAMQQADYAQVEHCRKQVELLRIQNSPTQVFEGGQAANEFRICVVSDDLVRVKQLIPSIEKMAERVPSWAPIKHWARGEYQRLRGDFANALSEFDSALQLVAPGRHIDWDIFVIGRLSALLSLGRAGEAKTDALEALAAAEREQLGVSALTGIRQSLALAQAALGETDAAIENAEMVINELEKSNITGLILGRAYETRARVAIAVKDKESFGSFAKRCAELYRIEENPVLAAKYQRLSQAALKAGLLAYNDVQQPDSNQAVMAVSLANQTVYTIISTCRDRKQRTERILRLLIEHCGAAGGLLFGAQKNGLSCLSRTNDGFSQETESELKKLAELYLEAEIEESTIVTMTIVDHTAAQEAGSCLALTLSDGKRFEPLVLTAKHNDEDKRLVVGLAALISGDERIKRPADELIYAISNALLENGDVVSAHTAV